MNERGLKVYALIVTVLVSLLAAAAILTLAAKARDPRGHSSPESLVRAYLRALEAKDPEGIEALASKDSSPDAEAKQHVRMWGGVDSGSVRATYSDTAVDKFKSVYLSTDGQPYLNVRLDLTQRRKGHWFLALGSSDRPRVDRGPALRESPTP